MPWIESHTVLMRHRKLCEFARELRVRPSHAMGHLHALWHAALEQREDGDLSEWSDEFIAAVSDFPGDAPQYVRLLQKHRWLDEKLVHDWLDYAGNYLTSKYKTSNRKRLEEIWKRHKREYGSKKEVDRKPSGDPPNGEVGEELVLPSRFPETKKQAIAASGASGASEAFVADTWDKAMSRGGHDAKGQEIRSWPHYVAREWKYEQERLAKKKPESKQLPEKINVRSL